MDAHLKLLAEVGLAMTEAEEALGAGEAGRAEEALDRAADGLTELRGRWPGLGPGERAIIGPAASPLRARLDAARARLPRRSALSEGAPERDPDEDRDPEETPAP
ncbi:MAG: hypothetical protein QOD81_1650 [Solirubrobacteraceae bacterium]|jgi:hypothetical protein|nr:hypothetical protein [Solirubrobacteraceae bacterium]